MPAINVNTGLVDFNIAFGILDSDGLEIENIERYFTLSARKYAYVTQPAISPLLDVDQYFTSKDNATFYKNIGIHKCTPEDKALIYPPNTNFVNTYDYYMEVLYCFDDLNDLTIFGDITTDYS